MATNLSFLLAALTAAVTILVISEAAIISVNDPRYSTWPKIYPTDPYVRIPVFVDTVKYATDTTCTTNIQAAITAINGDLTGCIQFVPITSNHSVGADFVYISNQFNTGQFTDTCQTVPGRLVGQNGNGQKMLIMSKATNGGAAPVVPAADCCTSTRDVMRYLANVIGLRNEYQRPDRTITVTTANIAASMQKYNMYNVYPTQNTTTTSAFDPNSITMVPVDKYSTAAGTAVYTGATPGTLLRLSVNDCNAIKQKYGCTNTCADPYSG